MYNWLLIFFSPLNIGLVFRLHDISQKSKLPPLAVSEWKQIFSTLRSKNYLLDTNRNELISNNFTESSNSTTISIPASQSIQVCYSFPFFLIRTASNNRLVYIFRSSLKIVLRSVLADRTRFGFDSPLHSHVSFADTKSGAGGKEHSKGVARPRVTFEHSPAQTVAIDFRYAISLQVRYSRVLTRTDPFGSHLLHLCAVRRTSRSHSTPAICVVHLLAHLFRT